MKAAFASILGASIVLGAGQAFADRVNIERLVYNGSGCPPGSNLSARLVDDTRDGLPDRLVVQFPAEYTARRGVGGSVLQRRKNCNLSIRLRYPRFLQFSLAQVRYFGSASLPRNGAGELRSDYGWPLSTNTATFENVLNGPFRGDFQRPEVLERPRLVFSPCSRDLPLSLRTQIFLRSGGAGESSLHSERHVYRLAWRRCPS